MRKFLAAIGIAVLAGCQVPTGIEENEMDNADIDIPTEEIVEAPAERPDVEDDMTGEEIEGEGTMTEEEGEGEVEGEVAEGDTMTEEPETAPAEIIEVPAGQ